MHILCNIQASAFNTEGEWLQEADSNAIFMLKYSKLSKHTIHSIPPTSSIKNVFDSRSSWDNNIMRMHVDNINPDIIWENDPCKVWNWKMLLEQMQLKIPIVCYNHWIDSKEYPKTKNNIYMARQIEGHRLADLSLCNSCHAAMQIRKMANRKAEVMRPLYDKDEYFISKKQPIVVYNHRLSPNKYYDDALASFLEALKYTKSKFKVVFTDASGKRPKIEVPNGIEYVVRNFSRKDYLQLLSEAKVVVGSFKYGNGGGWSMSLVDGLMSGCIVIIPDHSGYAEIMPENYPYFTTHSYKGYNSDAINLAEDIDMAMVETKSYRYEFMSHFDAEKEALKIDRRLQELWLQVHQ